MARSRIEHSAIHTLVKVAAYKAEVVMLRSTWPVHAPCARGKHECEIHGCIVTPLPFQVDVTPLSCQLAKDLWNFQHHQHQSLCQQSLQRCPDPLLEVHWHLIRPSSHTLEWLAVAGL